MKCLVTGGAGFIGSHIAQALCERGAKVIVLDNLSAGCVANLSWKKTGHDLDFIEGDVTDDTLLRTLVPGCDWIFHQAAIASVPRSIAEPLQSNHDNLEAALQLYVAARDAHVKRVLFASSSAIYGDSAESPKQESLTPNPISPYALQKYAAEKYGQLFHQLYGLQTVSLRYFNVFGPRQAFNSPYSGVIARFCVSMLQGCPPVVFGDGLQARDFIYIDNVVHANLLAAEASAGRVAGKIFNIAGGQSINLLDLVAEINRQTGQTLSPKFEPPRPGDVRLSQADVSAAQRDLRFTVKVPWQEGLRRTLDFYRQPLKQATGESERLESPATVT
jgi:UDP-glucose 4-epimerase